MNRKYWEMNSAELADATRAFDKEFVASRSTPLGAADRALHRKAGKPGRPKIGKGAYRINITVEQQLLARTDRFARTRGLTRSQLIAHALLHEMAGADGENRKNNESRRAGKQ
jgi:hypothetical protein